MKILMVTNTYTPIVGGVERSIKSFANEFERLGHEVLVVTLEFDKMPKEERGVVRVPAIRRFNGSDFSVRLPIPLNLSKVLETFKPDIVHSHHPFILGDTALRIANQLKVPLVFTHHTRYEDYTHYVPLDSPAMKRFVIELTSGYCQLADLVIAPSRCIYDLLMERGVKTPVEIIPTGVDFTSFSKGDGRAFRKEFEIKDNEFIVGHVGRLAPEKNLAFLIQSVILFLKEHKQAGFLLVGKGPSIKEIRDAFAKNNMTDRLIYAGMLEGQKLVDAYHAMDVFAFASKTETQGIVLLEAMSAGVPVVALSASGVIDVVKDQWNGRLIKNERVEDFTEGLKWFYQLDKEKKDQMIKDVREFAASISIDKTAAKMIGVYQRLLDQQFVSSDIENSPWAKAAGRIKTEWELISNLAEAVGSAFKNPAVYQPNWLQKLQRWLNGNEWSARLLGLSAADPTDASPGIVLIQIDGLALNQIKAAMNNGRMPFLEKLLKKEGYAMSPFYSGQPSSTPGVQAELFYGIKGAVPSFSFLDRESNEVFKMYHVDSAVEIEKRLQQNHHGLLKGGSSYSNIYSGQARETHFCAVDLGWDKLWREIKPVKLILLTLTHLINIFKTAFRLGIELISSCLDFIHGLVCGENFFKELKFIPTRLAICVLLRDLITFGAKIDIIRGLPVIHVNFLGYDEHAHRRGPTSGFAHWTLRGIDHCISKIYKESIRSQRRNYDVWIYSDHGQEDVRSYTAEHKKMIQQAVQEAFSEFTLEEDFRSNYDERGVQIQRGNLLGIKFFSSAQKRIFPAKDKLVVTAMGPVGHIFLPRKLTHAENLELARRLVRDVKIPLILYNDHQDKVWALNEKGVFHLPDDAREVFGKDHPYLQDVARDMIRSCQHPNAGTFTISGWTPGGKSWSFPIESGAHGGPGREETNGFALLPADIASLIKTKDFIRPLDLRKAALALMKRPADPVVEDKPERPYLETVKSAEYVRLMTYNVHGCKGMDARISPERIARVIARHQPDIVALQELDMNRVRSGAIDQPHILARELEMSYHFHPSFEVEEGHYGNAILSRYPMKLVCADQLPGANGKGFREPRGALWVAVDVNGRSLQIINTHLGLNRSERLLQVEALLGEAWISRADCSDPLVLIGDFNALPSSKVCQRIKQSLRDAQEEMENHAPKATWFGHLPLGRIDHVFVGKTIEIKRVEVPNTQFNRMSSDHLPLIVDICISGQ